MIDASLPFTARNEFENSAQDETTQLVEQGYEEISYKQIQISNKFQQCNALLLTNPYDGATLFKHAGPRSIEVVFGGTLGESFQDNYALFMKHTQSHGQKVIVTPVYGSISHRREDLIQEIELTGNNIGIQVDIRNPILIPSTKWVWHMLYNPQHGYAVTKHYEGNDLPVYNRHFIAGLQPEKFNPVYIEETLATETNRRHLKHQIKKMVSYSQPEQLQLALVQVQQALSPEELYNLLDNNLSDFQGTAKDVCVSEYRRQITGHSNMCPRDTLECLEILSRFDQQDDDHLWSYISATIECMEETSSTDLWNFATSKIAIMKQRITDPKLLNHVEDRERVAHILTGRVPN